MRKVLKMIDFIKQEWLFDKYLEQWSQSKDDYWYDYNLFVRQKKKWKTTNKKSLNSLPKESSNSGQDTKT